jgi:hypothetical protein
MALLIMYPIQRPVSTNEKVELIKRFKQEPEFQLLIDNIESISNRGGKLFSSENKNIINMLHVLLLKDFNQKRITNIDNSSGRIHSSLAKLNIFPDKVSSVTISNQSAFSYTGRIVDKRTKPSVEAIGFNLAGSHISEDATAQLIFRILRWGSPVNLRKTSLTYDLVKDLNLNPGEYEINLSSGSELITSLESRLALTHNNYELLSLTLSNLISASNLTPIDNDCFRSSIDAVYQSLNPIDLLNAVQDGSIFMKYIIPILRETGELIATLNSNNCTSSTRVSKLFNIFDLVELWLPVTWYSLEWQLSETNINGCVLLDNNYKSTDCFVIEDMGTVTANNYTCDTIEVSVKTLRNEKYFPYKRDALSFKEFNWSITPGHGSFHPDGKISKDGSSDVNGIATAKWILPDIESDVEAFASVFDSEVNKIRFTTKLTNPKAKVKYDNTIRIGNINERLSDLLYFAVINQVDKAPIKLSNFDISWSVVKGGGDIPVHVHKPDSLGFSFFEWTLGPDIGEQIVEATISLKNDKCSLQIDANKLIFKANAITSLDGIWEIKELSPSCPDALIDVPVMHKIQSDAPNIYRTSGVTSDARYEVIFVVNPTTGLTNLTYTEWDKSTGELWAIFQGEDIDFRSGKSTFTVIKKVGDPEEYCDTYQLTMQKQ